MQPGMECQSCGARYYSSASHQMVAEGERCSCGGQLRERPAPRDRPPEHRMPVAREEQLTSPLSKR